MELVEVMFDNYNTMGVHVVLSVMGIWDHGIKLDMLLWNVKRNPLQILVCPNKKILNDCSLVTISVGSKFALVFNNCG
jgi:hypothetical protein